MTEIPRSLLCDAYRPVILMLAKAVLLYLNAFVHLQLHAPQIVMMYGADRVGECVDYQSYQEYHSQLLVVLAW